MAFARLKNISQPEPTARLTPLPNQNDDALVREARERYTCYDEFWKDNYKSGDEDMQCLNSKYGPWPPEQIRKRVDADRPIWHSDIVSQFTRRIANQGRLNPRGIVITPKGTDANADTAEMREDRIRQIDYKTMAVYARQNALQNAVDRGIGFYMVTAAFSQPDDDDQEIGTRQIQNPKSVLVDPFANEPDWSDMKAAFVLKQYEYGAYRSRFKNAAVRSFEPEFARIAPGWVGEKTIQVAEYWKVETTTRTLLRLKMPEGLVKAWLDGNVLTLDDQKLPNAKLKGNVLFVDGQQMEVARQRESEFPKVKQYITNGFEILGREDWVGSTIPIIMVTGLRKYEDDKLVIESATRKMKAGQLAYDYAWTNIIEVFGALPKPHWKAVVGQTEEFPEWLDANKTVRTILRYRARTQETGDQQLGGPEFDHDVPDIGPYLMALHEAQQAVQQAAGMFAVQNQRREQQSGKAIEKLNTEQDVGNYHFSDYLDLAVQYEGRIKNEILRHIEDTDTMRGFRKADDAYERKQVTPMADPETGEVTKHPYGKGRDHDVIVKAGPSMQSQWEKASDFLDLLAENEAYAPLVMDLVVLMKQLGPLGPKLSKRFETLLPPAIRQQEKGQQAMPPEAEQAIQQLKAQLQEAMTQLEDFKSKRLELETKANIAADTNDARVEMNRENNDVKLAVAEIGAKVKMQGEEVSTFMQQVDHTLKIIMQGLQHAHEADQATAAAAQSAQSQQADQAHQQEMSAQAAAQQQQAE